MNELKPEIMELLALVGKKYSRNLLTTTDFDEFSLHLKSEHGYLISTSTLKRLWGYVTTRTSRALKPWIYYPGTSVSPVSATFATI